MFGLKTILAFVAAASLAGVTAAPAHEIEARITHTGTATYFYVGQGACGWWNVDSDWIVALNGAMYEQNHGSNCGQTMQIINTKTGKQATAQVADECPSCPGTGDLDLSPSLFSYLNNGNMDAGVFEISWHFNKKN